MDLEAHFRLRYTSFDPTSCSKSGLTASRQIKESLNGVLQSSAALNGCRLPVATGLHRSKGVPLKCQAEISPVGRDASTGPI